MPSWIHSLLAIFSLSEWSLGAVFVVSFLSATLLPLGSEPVVFGVIQSQPLLFWLVIVIATVGNTLGGAVNWWMGYAADGVIHRHHSTAHSRALVWLQKLGAKACLLAWLPVVGDPLCAVAGWLRLPLAPCAGWMLAGKFARYLVMTAGLLYLWPQPVSLAPP